MALSSVAIVPSWMVLPSKEDRSAKADLSFELLRSKLQYTAVISQFRVIPSYLPRRRPQAAGRPLYWRHRLRIGRPGPHGVARRRRGGSVLHTGAERAGRQRGLPRRHDRRAGTAGRVDRSWHACGRTVAVT